MDRQLRERRVLDGGRESKGRRLMGGTGIVGNSGGWTRGRRREHKEGMDEG